MSKTPSDDEDYEYRPMQSAQTGGPVRMPSQENSGMRIVKVDTPRVGTDGLREFLIAEYDVKAPG